MATPAGPLTMKRWEAGKQEGGAGYIKIWWEARTIDGVKTVYSYYDGFTIAGFDAYELTKTKYDEAKAILEAAPYLLEFPDEPEGLLRYGYREEA